MRRKISFSDNQLAALSKYFETRKLYHLDNDELVFLDNAIRRISTEAKKIKPKAKAECDCKNQTNQVCDTCQNVTGKEEEDKP